MRKSPKVPSKVVQTPFDERGLRRLAYKKSPHEASFQYPRGVELSQETPGLSEFLQTSGAKSGAFPADLAEVVQAWAMLPAEVQAAILSIVRGAAR